MPPLMPPSSELAQGPSRAANRRLLLGGLAYLALVVTALLASDRWAQDRAATQAGRLAESTAAARASLLVSELQKYRLLPVVLGEYPEVHAALSAPVGTRISELDAKLSQLGAMIGSSAIYLLDGDGRTIAASNAGLPTTFVGQNYHFRPYFTLAKARGAAEFFGLGTISGQPGLYMARRVGTAPKDGVIVVKFAFSSVERGWVSATEPAFVTDESGVVLITNQPGWQFRTTRALPAERLATMRKMRQFGDAPLLPLRIDTTTSGLVALASREGRPELYAHAELGVPVAGWTLHAFEPVRPLQAALLSTARLATLVFAILLLPILYFWLRARERFDNAAIARVLLEEQVALRTQQLENTQTRFREAREELAHANRLGSIGQITAAVAHEVNQPAAAIRSFAENGSEMLRRGDYQGVGANLATISDLTGRIGSITAELRTYARRGSGKVRVASLDRAIDGALLFTGHRLRASGIELERSGDPGIDVLADPIRLEQVLVNLLHNALDALAGATIRRLLLAVSSDGASIDLVLSDTGFGIAPDIADHLFTPFVTSKPDGLGLGLGIARDILREFGGELDVLPVAAPWTTAFRVRLRRA